VGNLFAQVLNTMSHTTVEAREATRFLEALSELLSSQQVFLASNKTTTALGPLVPQGQVFIGWDYKDENIIYLFPQVALSVIRKIADIRITKNALYQQLAEEGALAETDANNNKTTVLKRLGEKLARVLAIKREKLIADSNE
jgi:hypothetical protein